MGGIVPATLHVAIRCDEKRGDRQLPAGLSPTRRFKLPVPVVMPSLPRVAATRCPSDPLPSDRKVNETDDFNRWKQGHRASDSP